jgi:hypothetical protein
MLPDSTFSTEGGGGTCNEPRKLGVLSTQIQQHPFPTWPHVFLRFHQTNTGPLIPTKNLYISKSDEKIQIEATRKIKIPSGSQSNKKQDPQSNDGLPFYVDFERVGRAQCFLAHVTLQPGPENKTDTLPSKNKKYV